MEWQIVDLMRDDGETYVADTTAWLCGNCEHCDEDQHYCDFLSQGLEVEDGYEVRCIECLKAEERFALKKEAKHDEGFF